VSNPVADAFGIDRWGDLTSVDMTTVALGPSRPLEQLKARVACDTCNSGWMSDLEQQMPAVAEWARQGNEPLSGATVRELKRWLLKTHILLAAIEGGTRRFGTSNDFGVLPLVTTGRQLFEDDDAVFEPIRFGFAQRRTPPANNFSYRFETPEALHASGKQLNRRISSVSVVTIGRLECWTVAPFLTPVRIGLPKPLTDLASGALFQDLPAAPPPERMELVQVDFGDFDILSLFPS
jgi:hypothetical protein